MKVFSHWSHSVTWMSAARTYRTLCLEPLPQTLSGQPFDTVKVRMQTSVTPIGTLDCVRSVAAEGPLAFYKGTLSPLLSAAICTTAIQFDASIAAQESAEDPMQRASLEMGLGFSPWLLPPASPGTLEID